MIPFLIISALFMLMTLKRDNRKLTIALTISCILFCIIAFLFGGSLTSVKICSIISIIVIVFHHWEPLFSKEHFKMYIIAILISLVSIIVQLFNINKLFNLYELISSGTTEIPMDIASNFLVSAFNEIGMLIVIIGLLAALFSAILNKEDI